MAKNKPDLLAPTTPPDGAIIKAPETKRPKKAASTSQATASACSHINVHWTGEDKMMCELAKRHAGNHEADYTRGDKTTARASWRDEAGTPVS